MDIHGYTERGSISATIDGILMTVPDDPTNRHRQMIAEWEAEGNAIPAYEPPPVSPAVVKAECRRRILLIMSEDQQRNTLAAGQAATMQYGSDPANWPAPLQARQAAAMAAWAEIERLRARSNAIEVMEPIPPDITSDALWAAE
ncbi:hypothetical protein [uncultured Devosia sp.]|uniref:hypothetical protein n=1 Tax=uncultured Devosia sp. TaxID=211434 RepID=UPI002602B2C3|nr:hypothetical protein [uncultured Devosia sp.]